MLNSFSPSPKGRGAADNPANRFERLAVEDDFEHLEGAEIDDEPTRPQTVYFEDDSRSLVAQNNSPDVPFNYSVNPYRGCQHGCSYCYARPGHEYLGMSAGLDFETKIMVKMRAPELLRDWLARPKWKCEPICFSGVTDCYQPIERKLQVTRRCFEVALEARQPVMIITKNALIERDVDILAEMAQRNLVHAAISVTTLDDDLCRKMEPRTSSPRARLRAIRTLSDAGVPTRVMNAPLIPGLNDIETPAILAAAAEAGAVSAGYVLLRLPHAVMPIFLDWLERAVPERRDRVVSRIEATRGGKRTDAKFGRRMRGQGAIAEQIKNTFDVFRKKHGLTGSHELDTSQFSPPQPASGQMRLF